MCDWPVWGYYRDGEGRPCGNGEYAQVGRLWVCSKHFETILGSIIGTLNREASAIGAGAGFGPVEGAIRRELEYIDSRRRPSPAIQAARPAEWVYFAEREGFVKIGTTRSVERRLRELAAGGSMPDGMSVGPLRLVASTPGGRDTELHFHQKFDHLRLDRKREWFLYDEEIRAFVAGLKGLVAV